MSLRIANSILIKYQKLNKDINTLYSSLTQEEVNVLVDMNFPKTHPLFIIARKLRPKLSELEIENILLNN